jgi:PHD/YefM family antitoxin component YafN of YafNO toxin-antitoxin module
MAVTNEDLQTIRAWLIQNGTDVTQLPQQTTLLNTVAVTCVNTNTGQVVKVPLTAFAEWAETLNTQNNEGAQRALRAAAAAAKAMKDLQDALTNLEAATSEATGIINNINSAILAFLRPITQEQYDALVQADELEDRPYFIYEE